MLCPRIQIHLWYHYVMPFVVTAACASTAVGLPVETTQFDDDPRCDPLVRFQAVHELGRMFPLDELIEVSLTVVETMDTSCHDLRFTPPAKDDPLKPNYLVSITNRSSQTWENLHYVADTATGIRLPPKTVVTSMDGTVNGGLAFKIDNMGINTPLKSESITNDLRFEPNEVWEFILQDFESINGGVIDPAALGEQPPGTTASVGNTGGPSALPGSSGSIIGSVVAGNVITLYSGDTFDLEAIRIVGPTGFSVFELWLQATVEDGTFSAFGDIRIENAHQQWTSFLGNDLTTATAGRLEELSTAAELAVDTHLLIPSSAVASSVDIAGGYAAIPETNDNSNPAGFQPVDPSWKTGIGDTVMDPGSSFVLNPADQVDRLAFAQVVIPDGAPNPWITVSSIVGGGGIEGSIPRTLVPEPSTALLSLVASLAFLNSARRSIRPMP